MGKGSSRRPCKVSAADFSKHWDAVFTKRPELDEVHSCDSCQWWYRRGPIEMGSCMRGGRNCGLMRAKNPGCPSFRPKEASRG